MPTKYDNWLDPPDEEEEDECPWCCGPMNSDGVCEECDDDFTEPEPNDERPMGRRTEGGRTIYEEDFIYKCPGTDY